jgi:spermidine synthase
LFFFIGSRPIESVVAIIDKNKLLFLAAFSAGLSIMSLELAASRVLAPGFGGGIFVWGSLIGVVMVSLSLGYLIGGRLADSRNDTRFVFKILVYSGVISSIIPIVGEYVVLGSTLIGSMLGPIISTFVLFGPPMVLLSMVSPMVVKFSSKDFTRVGSSSGLVYSLSTVGSILGTFATAFILLPGIGTKVTILANAFCLFAVGLIGTLERRDALLSLVILLSLALSPHVSGLNQVYGTPIYSAESEYSIIRVYDSPEVRVLKMDDERFIQSYMRKDSILTGGYYHDLYSVAPLMNNGRRVLFIGMAGGTAIKQLRRFYNLTVDAVEIDGKVVDVAREYFNIKEGDGLRIFVADGRQFLRTAGEYDIIGVDVYRGGSNLPPHMATVEFFNEASAHMTDDGLLMMNVLTLDRQKLLGRSVASTMKMVFPSVYTVDMGGNALIVAFKRETPRQTLVDRLGANTEPLLENLSVGAALKIQEYVPAQEPIFTDDKSNIEEIAFQAGNEP